MEKNGHKFVMEKELYKKAAPLTVDMTPMGFVVRSGLELGGGGCSSCTTCG